MSNHDEAKHPRATNGTWTDKHRDEPEGDGLAVVRPSSCMTHTPTFIDDLQASATRMTVVVEEYSLAVDLVATAEAVFASEPDACAFRLEESDQNEYDDMYQVVAVGEDGSDLECWDVPDIHWPSHIYFAPVGDTRTQPHGTFSVDELRQVNLLKVKAAYEREAFAALFPPSDVGGPSISQAAKTAEVAVAYQDRGSFEDHLDRDLTDEEWGRIKRHLGSYDEWIDSSWAQDVFSKWRMDVLYWAGVED